MRFGVEIKMPVRDDRTTVAFYDSLGVGGVIGISCPTIEMLRSYLQHIQSNVQDAIEEVGAVASKSKNN